MFCCVVGLTLSLKVNSHYRGPISVLEQEVQYYLDEKN